VQTGRLFYLPVFRAARTRDKHRARSSGQRCAWILFAGRPARTYAPAQAGGRTLGCQQASTGHPGCPAGAQRDQESWTCTGRPAGRNGVSGRRQKSRHSAQRDGGSRFFPAVIDRRFRSPVPQVEPGLRTGCWGARRLRRYGQHASLSATSPPSSNRSRGPVPPQAWWASEHAHAFPVGGLYAPIKKQRRAQRCAAGRWNPASGRVGRTPEDFEDTGSMHKFQPPRRRLPTGPEARFHPKASPFIRFSSGAGNFSGAIARHWSPHNHFYFFRAKNISPLKMAHDSDFFASRKYLSRARGGSGWAFSEEKSPVRRFFSPPQHRHVVVTMLSTQKVTENYQNQPLIYLTGYQAIPISCGQGSGHPHPVVVDNVSGSFGNLVSPGSFCRL